MSKNENSGVGRPFAKALRSLLLEREEFLTQTGNINWRAAADALPGVHYETLRKAVAGERHPGMDLIEKVAALVGVPPHHFVEWQLAQAMRQFDARPAPLGVGFDSAMANLQRWTESQKGAEKEGSRDEDRDGVGRSVPHIGEGPGVAAVPGPLTG